jgi:hypothetical protein
MPYVLVVFTPSRRQPHLSLLAVKQNNPQVLL